MATSMYDYTSGSNDLTARYGQDQAVNDYARFISQRRGARTLDDTQRNFMRSFPRFQGSWARRGVNSDTRSGVYSESVGNYAEDYARNYNRQLEDQAGEQAGFDLRNADLGANFQTGLQKLYERLMLERGGVDPFAALRGLVGGS